MKNIPQKAQRIADLGRAVLEAAAPDHHAAALAALLEALAEDAEEGAQACRDAWGEEAPGRPWDRNARALRRAAEGFRKG